MRDYRQPHTVGKFYRNRASKHRMCICDHSHLASCEHGANMVEYALLAALVAMIVFAALQQFGLNLSTQFSNISSKVAAG